MSSVSKLCDFFVQRVLLSSLHLAAKSKATSTIEQQKCNDHENCDRLLASKVGFNYQISQ